VKVAFHVGQLLQAVPGGIGTYAEALLEALPAVGVTPVPFASGVPPADAANRFPGFVGIGRPGPPWRYELWHRFRRPRLRVPGDVVHATSLAIPPAAPRPLVVTVHDVAFLRHPELFTRHGVSFHRHGLDLARREAAAIVTPSIFTRDELMTVGFPAEQVHVIPHGAPTALGLSPEEDTAVLRRLGVSAPFIAFVGTLEPRKGIDTLTAAFAAVRADLPELSLVLAGAPGWGDVGRLDGDGVAALGAVTPREADVLWRHALCAAVPSRYEGFGLPALEAMARGCAVVASDATSLPEVVGDAGLLVAPGDVGAWVDALRVMVGDPNRREALATSGVQRAASFTWEASARAHAAVYASVAGGRPEGS